jgi:hypothetical protein
VAYDCHRFIARLATVQADSYHCAVRAAGKVPGFKRDTDDMSWGQVFAYAMRQPLLARELGMAFGCKLVWYVGVLGFGHGSGHSANWSNRP